ncbi:MAG: hypothetical protein Ct9H90mP14_2860 [Methanobacteriota archaeon]|nr:MAG: hypothetical protein Ct9H90mP14_2860 [Euryarchaeota archaeon]
MKGKLAGGKQGYALDSSEKEIEPQLADFLEETERTGRVGRMHHWVLIRPWDEAVLGLLGFDRVTRSGIAEWNLGYWVRSSEQRRGIASRAIEANFDLAR